MAVAPLALEACLITCTAATHQTAAATVAGRLATQNHGEHCRQAERTPSDNARSPRQQLSGDSAACMHGAGLTARAVLTTRTHIVVSPAIAIIFAATFDGAGIPAFHSRECCSGLYRTDLGLSLPLRI
jgi:hypothetical protein